MRILNGEEFEVTERRVWLGGVEDGSGVSVLFLVFWRYAFLWSNYNVENIVFLLYMKLHHFVNNLFRLISYENKYSLVFFIFFIYSFLSFYYNVEHIVLLTYVKLHQYADHLSRDFYHFQVIFYVLLWIYSCLSS